MKELIIAFIVLIAAPFCIGLLPARFQKKVCRRVCPLAVYLSGLLISLAVFQLIAVPVIMTEAYGFPIVVWIYSVSLAILAGIGLAAGVPVLKEYLNNGKEWIGRCRSFSLKMFDWEAGLYWLLALGLIVFQLYQAYTCAFFDGDDAYYVVQSVIADETDVLYRILPYTGLSTSLDIRHALAALPVWEAYLARVSGTHAAVMAHSILPLILIPAVYMLYFRIGMRLFGEEKRKTAVFMIVVSLLQIFGNTSIYTNATFFLMRTWQGKALLCNLVLLAEIWILLNLADGLGGNGSSKDDTVLKQQNSCGNVGWWILLVANHIVAAMMTTMGAFLVGLFVAVTGLVWAIREKRPGILIPLAASCIPCLIYLALYVFLAA